MKKHYYIIIIILFHLNAFSQQLEKEWISNIEGFGIKKVNDLIVLNKNIYLIGSFNNEIIFSNDTLISKGDKDIFFSKYDSNNK